MGLSKLCLCLKIWTW